MLVLSFACSLPAGGMLFGVSGLLLLLLIRQLQHWSIYMIYDMINMTICHMCIHGMCAVCQYVHTWYMCNVCERNPYEVMIRGGDEG